MSALVKTVEVDLKYTQSSWHRARKLWEALFRIAEAHKFESYDSILIDAKAFEEMLDDGTSKFYWEWYDVTGHTTISDYNPIFGHFCLITVEQEKFIISVFSDEPKPEPQGWFWRRWVQKST